MRLVEKLKKTFEDPRYPSLGPVVTFLRGICIWPKSRLQTIIYWTMLIFSTSFYLNQVLFMLYSQDADFYLNFLQYSVYHIGLFKIITFIAWFPAWEKLIEYFSQYELELQKDPKLSKALEEYIGRSRLLVAIFWGMSLFTNVMFFLKTWATVIEEVESNCDVRTKVFNIWWPFDDKGLVGSYVDMFVQNVYGDVTSAYVMAWDAMVVSMLVVVAGQLNVVKLRCRYALDSDDEIVQMENLVKCHNHYFSLVKMQLLCNSVVSPVMFAYLTLIAINFGVMLTSLSTKDRGDAFATILFMVGLMHQLFMLYWPANKVITESELVTGGVYESEWMTRSRAVRRTVLLLSHSTCRRLVFTAGPFNEMSLATFVSILRASYSFYTLMERRKYNI